MYTYMYVIDGHREIFHWPGDPAVLCVCVFCATAIECWSACPAVHCEAAGMLCVFRLQE